MAGTLDEGVVNDVINTNFKVIASMPAYYSGLSLQNAQFNNDMLNKFMLGNFAKQIDQFVTNSPEDAVATQITAGAGLADKIESLSSTMGNALQQIAASLAATQSMLQSIATGAGQSVKTLTETPPVSS